MKIARKLLTLLMVLSLLGCTTTKHYTSYTIYPIGYLLNRIGGNRISTKSIQNGSMVQLARINDDYKETLEDSIVMFHIGNLEPYMDIYEEDIKETKVDVQDLSVLNVLYEYKRYTPVYVEGKESFVEGPYYEGEQFEELDTYDLDPYIWLDPIGMYSMAKDVNDYLTSNYVEQSQFFQNNYEVLADELIALDASYQALATKLKNNGKTIKFVSMSASFGCWQKAFGFQVYPICLSKYGCLPSASQLEAIKANIVADNVKYIVYEPNAPEEMLQLMNELEEELGLKRVTLNNISSLTQSQEESGKDYMSLMYENLSILENMAVSIN